ncbi:hypothetical protein PFISCL1PPCAC_4009, partial [Pristionchus fissidentatus]
VFLFPAFIVSDELPCDDGTDNVVRLFNSPGGNNLVVSLNNVAMTTYDANLRTACNTTGGDITFPGSSTLNKGTMTISIAVDARAVRVELSMRKDDNTVGWVCVNGKAQNGIVEDDYCTFDLCNNQVIFAFQICDALTKPGTYKFDDNSMYLFFNPIPYENRNLMTGMWKISVEGLIEDQSIFAWTFLGSDDSGWVHITKTMVQ